MLGLGFCFKQQKAKWKTANAMIFRALQADVSFGELFPSANSLVDELCLGKRLNLLWRGYCSHSRDLLPLISVVPASCWILNNL